MSERQYSPEMVERVAQAIIETMFAAHELPISGDLFERYKVTASAAIEATLTMLREPTPEMLRLIRNPWGDATSFSQDSAENGYRRGIDAALTGPK